MLNRRWLVAALVLAPSLFAAANKEMIELQRDVALLQEQVRNLQRSQDEKLAGLTVMVQQSLDAAFKANTAVAVLDSGLRSILKDQEGKVIGPVANVGAKIDQMTNDVSALRESNTDLVGRLGRLQQVLAELSNAIKTLQAPPPPPPGAAPSAPGAAAAPVPPSTLWANAERDRMGGNLDLALQEYQDYLKNYRSTQEAPLAQFHVGEILLAQSKPDDALAAFDAVLEQFPDNPKTPDAIYMKGQTLVRMNQRTKGAEEFRALIKRFPSNSLAAQACTQLKSLGLSCAAPKPSPARGATTKKRK